MIDQRPDAPETVIRMSYPRLYASADRETHFQDVPVSMTPVVYVPDLPDHPLVDVATAQAVTALTFSRLEAGFFGDWHPRREADFRSRGCLPPHDYSAARDLLRRLRDVGE